MIRSLRRGFSILEVIVALGILAMALVVLVESQATAVLMTHESEDIMTATLLAKEKLNQVVLQVESEGFQEQDIEEEGDFARGIFGDFMAGAFDGNFEELNSDQFANYRWAFTVRKIDFSLGGDLEGMADTLQGAGLGPQDELQKEQMDQNDQQMDLGDVGVSSDMITDYLSPYIREVRVLVWWGDNKDEEDQVEIVTHLINPSGQIAPPPGVPQGSGGGDDGGDDGGGGGGGGGKGGGGSKGGSVGGTVGGVRGGSLLGGSRAGGGKD